MFRHYHTMQTCMLHNVVLSDIISIHITILYGVSEISKDLFRKKIDM